MFCFNALFTFARNKSIHVRSLSTNNARRVVIQQSSASEAPVVAENPAKLKAMKVFAVFSFFLIAGTSWIVMNEVDNAKLRDRKVMAYKRLENNSFVGPSLKKLEQKMDKLFDEAEDNDK